MSDNRETIIAKAIKDDTAMFTSKDILTAAGLSETEQRELISSIENNTVDVIEKFLRKKN